MKGIIIKSKVLVISLLCFVSLSNFKTEEITSTSPSPLLEPHLWEHRVLIVLTPTEKHPKFKEQLQTLDAVREGLKERDLFIMKNFNGNTIFAEEQLLSVGESRHLRKFYRLSPTAFTVLLIGKDGTVKLKSLDLIPIKKLFATIDAMPMRQAEMRTNSN